MDNLDLDVIILAHVALTLGAAISVSPAYNLPIALYGLTVAGKAERQFAGLHAITIILDLMWLVSGWTEQSSTLSIILVVTNMLLKVRTRHSTELRIVDFDFTAGERHCGTRESPFAGGTYDVTPWILWLARWTRARSNRYAVTPATEEFSLMCRQF